MRALIVAVLLAVSGLVVWLVVRRRRGSQPHPEPVSTPSTAGSPSAPVHPVGDCARLVLLVDRAHAAEAKRDGERLMQALAGRTVQIGMGLGLGSLAVRVGEQEPPGPARVTGATAVTLRVQEETLTIPCPRCGREGPVAQKFCGGCGAARGLLDLGVLAPGPPDSPVPAVTRPAPLPQTPPGRRAAQPDKKGNATFGAALFGLVVGGGMVYGGLTGRLVTKGTDTSVPVIVLGGLLALGGLVMLIQRLARGSGGA